MWPLWNKIENQNVMKFLPRLWSEFSDKSGFPNRHVAIVELKISMKFHPRLWSESGFPNRHVAVPLSMSRTTCSPAAPRLVYQTKPVPHHFHCFSRWKNEIFIREFYHVLSRRLPCLLLNRTGSNPLFLHSFNSFQSGKSGWSGQPVKGDFRQMCFWCKFCKTSCRANILLCWHCTTDLCGKLMQWPHLTQFPWWVEQL